MRRHTHPGQTPSPRKTAARSRYFLSKQTDCAGAKKNSVRTNTANAGFLGSTKKTNQYRQQTMMQLAIGARIGAAVRKSRIIGALRLITFARAYA